MLASSKPPAGGAPLRRPCPKGPAMMNRLKNWIDRAPVATFGPYALHKNHEIAKLGGPDRGRYSLTGATCELDEGSELNKRVTVPRFLAIGFFALAVKKKTGGEKYLLISGPEFTWLEEIPADRSGSAIKFARQVQAAIAAANRSAGAEK